MEACIYDGILGGKVFPSARRPHGTSRNLNQKMAFDLNAARIFLTYPSKRTPGDILDDIKTYPNVVMAIVATETYATGGKHYHVYVETLVKTRWTMRQLDSIGGVHGHYKRVELTPRKVIAYCVKDNDYMYWPQSTFVKKVIRNSVKEFGKPQSITLRNQIGKKTNFKFNPSYGPMNRDYVVS